MAIDKNLKKYIIQSLLEGKTQKDINFDCKKKYYYVSPATIYNIRTNVIKALDSLGLQIGNPILAEKKEKIINDLYEKLCQREGHSQKHNKEITKNVLAYISEHCNCIFALDSIVDSMENDASKYVPTVFTQCFDNPDAPPSFDFFRRQKKFISHLNEYQYVPFSICSCQKTSNADFHYPDLPLFGSKTRHLANQYMLMEPTADLLDFILATYIPQYIKKYASEIPIPSSYSDRVFFACLKIKNLISDRTIEIIEEYNSQHDNIRVLYGDALDDAGYKHHRPDQRLNHRGTPKKLLNAIDNYNKYYRGLDLRSNYQRILAELCQKRANANTVPQHCRAISEYEAITREMDGIIYFAKKEGIISEEEANELNIKYSIKNKERKHSI